MEEMTSTPLETLLLERIRSRMELLERPPVVAPSRAPAPPSGQRPPPLPWQRARGGIPPAAPGKGSLH